MFSGISHNVYFSRREKVMDRQLKTKREILISRAKFAFCQVGGKNLPQLSRGTK